MERITGVPTSVTAFVSPEGAAEPVQVQSFFEFERSFPSATTLRAAVELFFVNGGTDAVIVDKLEALEQVDLFNLLCFDGEPDAATRDEIAAYCAERRAMFLVDPPASWTSAGIALQNLDSLMARHENAALYFPHLVTTTGTVPPSGAIAGIYARTDAARGVWKAPAGIEATVAGINALSVKLTDRTNGDLNVLGVNCLRAFPTYGNVVWGARTLKGADVLASEWKYVPVRRLTLYLEESIDRGTEWVVHEPNDEPLWGKIRLLVSQFMNDLFRSGALAGATAKDAYFVNCDATTTTQDDIDNGIVNIDIGFAPLKPAEFVWIRIRQMAGRSGQSDRSRRRAARAS